MTTTEIRFYRASEDFGFLSNLFRLEVPLWLPDEFDESAKLVRKASYFQTSEAAYQYGKPKKQEVADWIASAPAPHLCAAAAHALFVFDVRPNGAENRLSSAITRSTSFTRSRVAELAPPAWNAGSNS